MDMFIGTIIAWPMEWAPEGWVKCDGSLLPIMQYQALYSLIGIKYGGNGTTNFAVPDLRGRLPMGMGQRPGGSVNYQLGNVNGNENSTITGANLPTHKHGLTATNAKIGVSLSGFTVKQPISQSYGGGIDPTNSYPAKAVDSSGGEVNSYSTAPTANAFMAPATVTGNASVSYDSASCTENTGTGTAMYTMPPFQTINYIIAVQGIYPQRP